MRTHASYSQRNPNARYHRRTARLMRGITIAVIVALLILAAICFITGFVLMNMATGEW